MAATPNKNPISASKRLEPAAEFMLAFNSHGTDKILSFMSANPVWEFAAGLDPDGFMHRGPAAVRAVIESSFKNFPDVSYRTLRTYDAGDSVIIEILILSPSKNLKYHAADFVTFDGEDEIAIKRTYRKVVTPQ
jgi:ketosteroid isomerase-like protein